MESPSRRNPERRLLEAARYVVIPPGEASARAGPPHHDIVVEKRGITADPAVRLASFFDTSPEFWMNAQSFYEVRRAQTELAPELNRIVPRQVA